MGHPTVKKRNQGMKIAKKVALKNPLSIASKNQSGARYAPLYNLLLPKAILRCFRAMAFISKIKICDTFGVYGVFVRVFSGFSRQAEKRLEILDAAESTADLAALLGNRFEALSGDRNAQFSIRINQQW